MKLSLAQAVQMLKVGKIVAVPTETVYGLAVSLKYPKSMRRIFKLKGRPVDNPLIVHIGSFAELQSLVKKTSPLFERVKKFWPGPLTVVFEANLKNVPTAIRAGLKTVAVRMPRHPLMRRLLQKTGPLAAPSANISGTPSPTRAQHVLDDFGKNIPVLDGGACEHGVESTVVFLKNSSWEILRPGSITEEMLENALGKPPQKSVFEKKPRSPGQKYRHYAPKAKLDLCFNQKEFKKKQRKKIYDAVLGFSNTPTQKNLVDLGQRNDFKTNLKLLFSGLRKLDEKKYKNVLVDCDFKPAGLGKTLRERLTRAGS